MDIDIIKECITKTNPDSSVRTAQSAGVDGLQEPHGIEEITAEIRNCQQQVTQSFIMIGKLLIEAKEQLEHGEWLDWLKNRVEMSERMAQRHMRLAQEYPNPSTLTDLGFTKALTLLSLPQNERESFIGEPHEINGVSKHVPDMSTRELETVVREHTRLKPTSKQKNSKIHSPNTCVEEQSPCELAGYKGDVTVVDVFAELQDMQGYINSLVEYLEKQRENPEIYQDLYNALRDLCQSTLQRITVAEAIA